MSDGKTKTSDSISPKYIGLGIIFGEALGTAFGAAFSHIGIGIAFGAGLGCALGIAISTMRGDKEDNSQTRQMF